MTFTKPQEAALRAALERGGALLAPVRRTGGAHRRCCERLVSEGLLHDEPPFRITKAGLKALVEIRSRRWAKHGCMAYLDDLRAAEDALTNMESAR